MRKRLSINFTYILFIVFIVWTSVVLFTIYKQLEYSFDSAVIIGYVIFLLLYVLYLIIKTILRTRKLKWVEIRKRMLVFLALFILFSGINFVFQYLFKQSKPDFWKALSIPLGSALGASFIDLAFLKKDTDLV